MQSVRGTVQVLDVRRSSSSKAASYLPYTGMSAPISRSGMVQKLMREIGPSVSTRAKYFFPFWMVVEAFQLKRMVTFFRHGLCAGARLPVAVSGVERKAHDLELLASPYRPFQGIELVYLVHFV